jgi:hypothetical protein
VGGGGAGLIGFSTVPGAAAEFFGHIGIAGGNDTLDGFSQIAGDRILLNGLEAANSVAASAQTANGNTTITFADGSQLTLLNITNVNDTFFS